LPLRSEKPKPSIGYAKAARQQSQPGGLFKACANPAGGDKMMILQRFLSCRSGRGTAAHGCNARLKTMLA
jgi:hypothetical protein